MPKCLGCSNTVLEHERPIPCSGADAAFRPSFKRCGVCGLRYAHCAAPAQVDGQPNAAWDYWVPVAEDEAAALEAAWSVAALLALMAGRQYLVETPDGDVERAAKGARCEALQARG